MKTPIEELITLCENNAENIETQSGVKMIIVDFEVLRNSFYYFIQEEKQAFIDAHRTGELCKKGVGTLTTRSNEYYNQKYNK